MPGNSLLLPISDFHIGRRAEGMTLEELEERFGRYIMRVKSFISLLASKPDTIHVALLGDIVDGEEIYRGHGYELEYNIHEQIEIAQYLFAKMKDFLDKHAREYKMYCAPGNHGIANRRGTGNYDFLLCKALERDFDIEIFDMYETPAVIDVSGTKVALYHGHGIRMYMNVPYYGIDRMVTRWGYHNHFDMLVMGHFHTFARIRVMDKDVYLNGTMLYDDPWVRQKLGAIPDARWWAILISPDGSRIEQGVPLV